MEVPLSNLYIPLGMAFIPSAGNLGGGQAARILTPGAATSCYINN